MSAQGCRALCSRATTLGSTAAVPFKPEWVASNFFSAPLCGLISGVVKAQDSLMNAETAQCDNPWLEPLPSAFQGVHCQVLCGSGIGQHSQAGF